MKYSMNPKQESIGKKIRDKCRSDVNNKHGPYDQEIRKILDEKLNLSNKFKDYNNMFNILDEIMQSGRYRKLNIWLRDPINNYGLTTRRRTSHNISSLFFYQCLDLLRKKNPNVKYDTSKHQIVEQSSGGCG